MTAVRIGLPFPVSSAIPDNVISGRDGAGSGSATARAAACVRLAGAGGSSRKLNRLRRTGLGGRGAATRDRIALARSPRPLSTGRSPIDPPPRAPPVAEDGRLEPAPKASQAPSRRAPSRRSSACVRVTLLFYMRRARVLSPRNGVL